MNNHKHHELAAVNKSQWHHQKEVADFLVRMVKTLTGALISTALISLFSIVIFAFVVKAFITSEEMSFQLLHSAITLVSTSLAAALGYYLGKNSSDKTEGKS
jgi:hypothetical protein